MSNIIITGTSRGIGFEVAKQCADLGHKVLALSRNVAPIEALGYPNITALPFDITSEEAMGRVRDYIATTWGRVEVLIHNAGRLINKPFEALTLSDFSEVYAVNLFGVVRLTQVMLPFMQAGAHIISISSMGGVQGSVKFAGLAAYSSSKGALITLMEVLAEELKERGIACNTLALGAVQTEMLSEAFPDYKATVTPEEMARYITEFALSGAKLFNGKTLQVANSTP